MLKMKPQCERCSTKLSLTDQAFVCSYECTFCETCTEAMKHICPNCAGELVRRPRRTKAVIEVAIAQVKRKLLGA